jgi:hypothetical protein
VPPPVGLQHRRRALAPHAVEQRARLLPAPQRLHRDDELVDLLVLLLQLVAPPGRLHHQRGALAARLARALAREHAAGPGLERDDGGARAAVVEARQVAADAALDEGGGRGEALWWFGGGWVGGWRLTVRFRVESTGGISTVGTRVYV